MTLVVKSVPEEEIAARSRGRPADGLPTVRTCLVHGDAPPATMGAMATKSKIRILFLCTANACRSQMAEGWARVLKGDAIEAQSAGVEAAAVDPRAVQVMAEAGVDISGQRSKTVAELPVREFDYVVTLCGHAHETCPHFPRRAKVVHVGFDDPPELAKSAVSEEEALLHYRRVRDEIRAFVERLPHALEE